MPPDATRFCLMTPNTARYSPTSPDVTRRTATRCRTILPIVTGCCPIPPDVTRRCYTQDYRFIISASASGLLHFLLFSAAHYSLDGDGVNSTQRMLSAASTRPLSTKTNKTSLAAEKHGNQPRKAKTDGKTVGWAERRSGDG